jgi:hypothetical protein
MTMHKTAAFVASFLLTASLCVAAGYYRELLMLPRVAGGAAPASITVDVWQDFEFDGEITAAALSSNDHTSAGSWTVSANQSPVWTTTADEKATASSINGTADAGTRGMRRSYTNPATSYVQFNLPEAKTNISVGFWWRAPNTPSWAGGNVIVYAYYVATIKFSQAGTAGRPTIRIGAGGDNGADSSALVPGSWYWITARLVKNGTCSCVVYDSAGAAIATQPGDVTGLNNNIESVLIGEGNAYITADTFHGIDDVVVDYTDATFPLGP